MSSPVADIAYAHLPTRERELEHRYGDNVHILADPFLLTHLAFLCAEGTQQPAINQVVRDLYQYWKPGMEPPAFEDLVPEEEAAAPAAADGGDGPALSEAAKRVPPHLFERSRAARARLGK